jgi:cysteine-rich repeat protein
MRFGNKLLTVTGLASLLFAAGCGDDVNVPNTGFDASMFDANLGGDMGVVPVDMSGRDLGPVLPDLGRDMPPPMCGNFAVELGEDCDDGNHDPNDGCDPDCHSEGTCAVPLDFATLATAGADGTLSYSADNVSATDLLMGGCGSSGGKDFVFTYTPASDGLLTVDTIGSSYDTVLYIRTTCASVGSELDCDDDSGGSATSSLSVNVTHDVPLFIVIDGFNTDDVGNFTLHTKLTTLAAAGEACDPAGVTSLCNAGLVCAPAEAAHTCQAVDIGCGVSVPVYDLAIVDGEAHFSGNTSLGSATLMGSCGSTAGSGSEIVHRFVMPFDGNFDVSMSAGFDSVSYIRTGTCAGAEAICTDSTNISSTALSNYTSGTAIFLVVDGYAASAIGSYSLNVAFSRVVGDGQPCGATAMAHCADGLVCHTDGATSVCRAVMCNDGLIEGTEECEDGNTAPGDGCSAMCMLEDQGVGGDTCAAPVALVLAPTGLGSMAAYATGDTTGAAGNYGNECVVGMEDPDVVYSLTTTETSDIIVRMIPTMGFNGAVSIRGGGDCATASTEISCDSGTSANYAYAFGVEPGTYYIIVDGQGDTADDHGMYGLEVSTDFIVPEL